MDQNLLHARIDEFYDHERNGPMAFVDKLLFKISEMRKLEEDLLKKHEAFSNLVRMTERVNYSKDPTQIARKEDSGT